MIIEYFQVSFINFTVVRSCVAKRHSFGVLFGLIGPNDHSTLNLLSLSGDYSSRVSSDSKDKGVVPSWKVPLTCEKDSTRWNTDDTPPVVRTLTGSKVTDMKL